MGKAPLLFIVCTLVSYLSNAQEWTNLEMQGDCGGAPTIMGVADRTSEKFSMCFKSPFGEEILGITTLQEKLKYPADENEPWRFTANIKNLTNSSVKIQGYYMFNGKKIEFYSCLKPNELQKGADTFDFCCKYSASPTSVTWNIEYMHPNSPCW